MQVSATPIIAQISGQAIVGAVDSAINAGFSDDPTAVLPNGGGFTYHIALDQPENIVNENGAGTGRPASLSCRGGFCDHQI